MAIYRLKRFGSSAAEDHREKRKAMDIRSIIRDAALGGTAGLAAGALTASPDSDTFVNKDQIHKHAVKTAIAGAVGVTVLGMGRRAIDNALRKKDEPKQKEYAFRGYGRGTLLGGIGGAAGTHVGGNKGIEAREGGASDAEARKVAAKHGAKVGALVQGGLGAANSIADNAIAHELLKGTPNEAKASDRVVNVALSTALNAGRGAVGGYFGADKNYRVNRDEASESTRKGWDKKRSDKD